MTPLGIADLDVALEIHGGQSRERVYWEAVYEDVSQYRSIEKSNIAGKTRHE